ncbi:MAG: bifunctional phosphopantothenoylcysteine decarboxylase/phosphopantothenate--cysteine ligase CoaBC [Eubacterium sp.]|nr:bifunctional phosphopantothenoylcysteine decarboxylase/phosphopantothenate--cysteine ligase CoaBC [Eubacterium sp.]
MLKEKKILLGVSGGIAAYKMANVASMLVKLNADVHVVMTENATKIITKEAFEVLTKNKVYTDVFAPGEPENGYVPHVHLGETADAILIAPATANIIGKIANGIADDMLSTTVLPARCPVIIAPSMNVHMYENRIVQSNIEKLRRFGFIIVEPSEGHLACGYDGKGKLPEEAELVDAVLKAVAKPHDLEGKKVLVTAGPTEEALDPVRFITNHSSGKMGYALAEVAAMRGADVTLISGPTSIRKPYGIKIIDTVSAEDMYNAVMAEAPEQDIIIMSAAVADYTPVTTADEKIKKNDGDMAIPLKRTKDILKTLGEIRKPEQFICGFSMETENVLENSRAKLIKKNVDMICANSLRTPGAGYKVDTNIVTIITGTGMEELPIMTKHEVSDKIFDAILRTKNI